MICIVLTCSPINDTPEDLVKIDFYTGQILVDKSGAIDADFPKRWYLYYTIEASDRCYAENVTNCPPDPTSNYAKGNVSFLNFFLPALLCIDSADFSGHFAVVVAVVAPLLVVIQLIQLLLVIDAFFHPLISITYNST